MGGLGVGIVGVAGWCCEGEAVGSVDVGSVVGFASVTSWAGVDGSVGGVVWVLDWREGDLWIEGYGICSAGRSDKRLKSSARRLAW